MAISAKGVTALVLAAMVFSGPAYVGPAQKVLAHNFSHTETTEFLAATWMTKAYAEMARFNVGENPELASMYAEQATTFLYEYWISEIAETNQRIATNLSASLNQLPMSISEA